jgi:hypothetical protein
MEPSESPVNYPKDSGEKYGINTMKIITVSLAIAMGIRIGI